jgi:DNA-directed RNA polymerase subunit RPC12/RpoP
MLKEIKSRVISGLIVATIIGVVQWVFKYPILQNIWWCIKLIWNNVFRIKLELWLIILIILLVYIINKLIRSTRNNKQTNLQPRFKNYTRDKIGNCFWTWEYTYDTIQKANVVKNLQPICNKCDTTSEYKYDVLFNDFILECPRCDNKLIIKTKEKVEAIIVDNIKRSNY